MTLPEHDCRMTGRGYLIWPRWMPLGYTWHIMEKKFRSFRKIFLKISAEKLYKTASPLWFLSYCAIYLEAQSWSPGQENIVTGVFARNCVVCRLRCRRVKTKEICMTLPSLKIGALVAKIPIVQGGMGVGISLHRLAAAVAAEGGVGVIAGAMIGMREHDIAKNPIAANSRALATELKKAKEITSGIIGVNIMVALTDFSSLVRTAIAERADIIFAGAGLPTDLPRLLREVCEEKKEAFHTKLVPIVSSARAAGIICKKWLNRSDYLPDAFVVEGPKAGGHLGYKPEELDDPQHALETVLPEVVDAVKAFEDEHGRAIPVIAAGGVYSGDDIRRFLDMGASGVQMGTRFVAT